MPSKIIWNNVYTFRSPSQPSQSSTMLLIKLVTFLLTSPSHSANDIFEPQFINYDVPPCRYHIKVDSQVSSAPSWFSVLMKLSSSQENSSTKWAAVTVIRFAGTSTQCRTSRPVSSTLEPWTTQSAVRGCLGTGSTSGRRVGSGRRKTTSSAAFAWKTRLWSTSSIGRWVPIPRSIFCWKPFWLRLRGPELIPGWHWLWSTISPFAEPQ